MSYNKIFHVPVALPAQNLPFMCYLPRPLESHSVWMDLDDSEWVCQLLTEITHGTNQPRFIVFILGLRHLCQILLLMKNKWEGRTDLAKPNSSSVKMTMGVLVVHKGC